MVDTVCYNNCNIVWMQQNNYDKIDTDATCDLAIQITSLAKQIILSVYCKMLQDEARGL